MTDNYPSFPDLFHELKVKRREIEGIMRKHHIYDWPLEHEFEDWMIQEPRLTEEGRQQLAALAEQVNGIKEQLALRLKRK